MIFVNSNARPMDTDYVQKMFADNIQQSSNFLLHFSFINIKMRFCMIYLVSMYKVKPRTSYKHGLKRP